jgi:hypothetical protein
MKTPTLFDMKNLSEERTHKRIPVTGLTRPCNILRYCPYGPLVEQFPLDNSSSDMYCKIFGHHCPVYYCAEMFDPELYEVDEIDVQPTI